MRRCQAVILNILTIPGILSKPFRSPAGARALYREPKDSSFHSE